MRRPAPRWPALLALLAAGLLLGLLLAAGLALPRLTAFEPAQAATASSRAPLRLIFNRAMHPASVEAALRLQPEQPGDFVWEGNTLVFRPRPAWPEQTVITVTLAGGRSALGLPLLGRRQWTFRISGQRVAYLAGEPANLWAIAVAGEAAPQALTRESYGVYDFDVSPDGAWAAYAALRADGGADLRRLPLDGRPAADLLACPEQSCLSPAIAPDGQRVAYERHTRRAGVAGETTRLEARIHLFTPSSGEDTPLGEPDNPARFPRWSRDGRLSYFDVARQALVVYDPLSGQVTYIPNTSGEAGAWSPDGLSLVFAEIFFPPEPTPDPLQPEAEHVDRFYSRLLEVTVATNAVQDLSGAGLNEDASPVFSPDGQWLAFARRGQAPGQWSPGRQLWRMRADGTQAQALTAEPFFNFSSFSWSPDGTRLATMRLNVAEAAQPPEIWVLNADGSSARPLVTGAYLPRWLP